MSIVRPATLLSKRGLLPQASLDLQAASLSVIGDFPAGSTFTRASLATRFNESGALEEVASGVMRRHHDASGTFLGLLFEEGATNIITNPRFEGGATGSPGTAPTGMSFNGVGGWSQEIVGFGTEDGIPYIDLRIWSPASNGNINNYRLNITVTGFTGTTGNAFTASAFHRLMAGDFSAWNARFVFGSEGGIVNLPKPTSAPLKTQRVATTRTLAANQTSTFISYALITPGPNGAGAGDVTVRIGLPMVQTGIYASMPTMPPIGSPGSSSRAKDILILPAGLITGLTDTISMDCIYLAGASGNGMMLSWGSPSALTDGTNGTINAASNQVGIRQNDNGSQVFGVHNLPGGPFTNNLNNNARGQFCFAYGGGTGWASWNNETLSIDASVPTTTPAAPPVIRFGTQSTGAAVVSPSWLFRRLRVWSGQKLSQAQTRVVAGQL
jgi:hypothetical protein